MLILHFLRPIFPSTVSGAAWVFTLQPKLCLEELFHRGVVPKLGLANGKSSGWVFCYGT